MPDAPAARRLPHPGVRFPPPTVFVVAFFAGWLLHREWPIPLVPGGRRPIGVGAGWALVAIGLGFTAWGLVTFFRHRTAIMPHQPASRLVDGGPYRYSRNPMYVGMTTAYLGGVLVTNMLWPLLLLPLSLAALTIFVIRREERYLGDAFGDEYAAYRSRTRRWL